MRIEVLGLVAFVFGGCRSPPGGGRIVRLGRQLDVPVEIVGEEDLLG